MQGTGKFIGRTLNYSDYLKISKNLESQKRTHSGQKPDQSMFKSEHQRTGGQLYISINLPSSLPTPLSPSAQWNEPEKEKMSLDIFYCGKLFLKKGKADVCHFDICVTKLMWTKKQKKVPMNLSK